ARTARRPLYSTAIATSCADEDSCSPGNRRLICPNQRLRSDSGGRMRRLGGCERRGSFPYSMLAISRRKSIGSETGAGLSCARREGPGAKRKVVTKPIPIHARREVGRHQPGGGEAGVRHSPSPIKLLAETPKRKEPGRDQGTAHN